jgi:phenol 2-monooxygenase
VYSVGQRVARNFCIKDCVFLAGDACHTHSSGAAQGMNTGLHDACNLGWKLSVVLHGIAAPTLLHTYEDERRPNVQKLINYDKDISRLMTMQLPIGWDGDPNADPNEILGIVMAEAATFTSGLSIAFETNTINVNGSFTGSAVLPGQRGPDVQLQKPGTMEVTRLHSQTPNNAQFHIVLFVGEPEHTTPALKLFTEAVEESKTLRNISLPVSWLVIPARSGPSAFELLGGTPLGKVLYDKNQTAHERYGVDVTKGGVFVMRPDGWIGTATELGIDAVQELELYFRNVF